MRFPGGSRKNVGRFLEILTWDGILPVCVALTVVIVNHAFPNGHLAEIVACVILPIVVALLRSAVGWRQLAFATNCSPGITRQLALSFAIILLLLLEMLVGVLQFAGDAPFSVWWVALGLYLGYLITILWALRASGRSVTEPTNL